MPLGRTVVFLELVGGRFYRRGAQVRVCEPA